MNRYFAPVAVAVVFALSACSPQLAAAPYFAPVAVAVAVAVVFALSACSPQPAAAPDVSPAPTSESVPAPAPATEPTLEERARGVAISMDPVFADDAVWEQALVVAQTYCDLATEVGPDGALTIMVSQAEATGITWERAGILIGIGQNLYCPEFIQ